MNAESASQPEKPITERTAALMAAADALIKATNALNEGTKKMNEYQDVTAEVRLIRQLLEAEQAKRAGFWAALKRAANQFFSQDPNTKN